MLAFEGANVEACGRASVWVSECTGVLVYNNVFKRGLISVRAWSVKRVCVECLECGSGLAKL